MRVINLSTPSITESRPNVTNAVRKIFKVEDPKTDPVAEKAVIDTFQRIFDNQYVVLRSVPLNDPETPIPMVLVGPSGVRMIYPRSIKGVYRAKEDAWEELDDRTQKFKIARPNLLQRGQMMAKEIEAFLVARNFEVGIVEPVLVFSDPGVHVDTIRPIVRIVQADALDRFGAGSISRVFGKGDDSAYRQCPGR